MAEEVELGEPDARPRRRARIGLAAAAVVAVGVLVAVQLVGDDNPSELASGSGSADGAVPEDDVFTTRLDTSTTTVDATSTTMPTVEPDDPKAGTGQDPIPSDGGGTATPGGPAEVADTTTTTICVDSFEPGCGPFRWASPVGTNRPLAATIELLTESPVAGKDIEFRVVASDPDAMPRHPGVWFGIPGGQDAIEPFNCWGYGAFEGFGPWQPPAPRGGSIDTTVVSRTAQTGNVRVYLCLNSHSLVRSPVSGEYTCAGDGRTHVANLWMCRDPYGSFASPYVDIVIQPAP